MVAGACLYYSSLQFNHLARHRINAAVARASKKLGLPIDIGRFDLTFGGARFSDVRIGAEAQIVISSMQADLNLNPFTGSFLAIDNISVAHLRIKAPEANVRSSLMAASQGGVPAAQGAQAKKFIDGFFAALPSERLAFGGVGITLMNDAGEPELTVQGLNMTVDRSAKQILVKVEGLTTKDGAGDRNLQGRFELSPGAADYRFFVRRKTGPDLKRNAWAASGILQKDLSAAQLKLELHAMPGFLAPLLRKLPVEDLDLRGRSVVEIARGEGGWQFTAQAQSVGSNIRFPLVSTQQVGPLYFDLRVSGSWQKASRTLSLDTGTLTLPNRDTREYGETPTRLALSGSWRQDQTEPGAFMATLHATLPVTPCQQVLEAAPSGLFPALAEFHLDGQAGATLDLSAASKNLAAASFSLHDTVFNCRVLEAPYAYSAERLNGPFSVLRQERKDEEPTYIDINPRAPSYTALAGISKNLNAAFVASEDASFFSHKGIDPFALDSAIRRDLTERRVAVGGSTITMQTVKNLFLSQDRTLSRKLQELFLAWHLERTLSKDRILEIYMNIVELGPGIYGVTRASQHFFGKNPFDLNLMESAYLATLLPSPKARYRYFCAGHLTPNFQELVGGLLKRMQGLNRISTERFVSAMATAIHFNEDARLGSRDCAKKPGDADIDNEL